MKNAIRRFYERFDRFLEKASSGDIRSKARITAFLTMALIILLILSSGIIAFINFEITIPIEGVIYEIHDKTIGFKLLMDEKYQELIKPGQKIKLWIPLERETIFQGDISAINKSLEEGEYLLYFKNTIPFLEAIGEDIVNRKVKGRVIIGEKKVYELLISCKKV